MVLDARADFGRHAMSNVRHHRGHLDGPHRRAHLRWSGAQGAKAAGKGALGFGLELEPGTHHDLVLEVSDRALPDAPVNPDAAWAATETAWAEAVPDLSDTLAPRDARHAYAVLRGLTSAGGGMVAAATMCLPERAEAGRNYDYRYAWIRDQCYAGQAVAVDQPHPLLDDAVNFIAQRVLSDGPQLKPAYRIDGGPVPDERPLLTSRWIPGGKRQDRQLGQLAVPARCVRRSAAALRHRGAPRSPRERALAGRRDHRRGHRVPLARSRRRDLGTRQPAVGALSADVRGRPAGDR